METPPRSLLFVPGHRESMLAKSVSLGADAIVFDLEDSVPPDQKDLARELVTAALASWPENGPLPVVRVNSPRSSTMAADAAVVRSHPSAAVVVPKVDRPLELAAVFDAVGRDRAVIVNLETPRSILGAESFADTYGVDGIFLGGEDLTNALGMIRTSEGDELTWPRFMVLVAARAAGIAAYDTICPEFRDLAVLERDCRRAAEMGFDGKFAIHPAQIPVIQRAFTPSDAEIERSRRIVAAFDDAVARGHGAVAVDGTMIDPPVAERARAMLRRSKRS